MIWQPRREVGLGDMALMSMLRDAANVKRFRYEDTRGEGTTRS